MMTFGEKCPACGHPQLSTRTPASLPAWLPTAKPLICERCHQPLLTFFGISLSVECRRHLRTNLPPFFLVRIPGQTNQFARISNISEGGICFSHRNGHPCPAAGQHLFLDLYNCNEGSSLEQLLVQIVASRQQPLDLHGIPASICHHSGRFVHLSHAQSKVLANCIQQYGTSQDTLLIPR